MPRILDQPLLHFFVGGALLFGVFWLVDPGDEAAQSTRNTEIVVTDRHIDSLGLRFAKARGRPPNERELRGLVDDYVREEVMYREALAMGLDRDDTIVRRRMQQKLEFLLEDTASLASPTDAELEAHLAGDVESFREPPTFDFVQIYFDLDGRGDEARADAEATLARLRGAEAPIEVETLGDPTMMGQRFEGVPEVEVIERFGSIFAERAASVELGTWTGPVESAFGLHLFRVDARTAGRVPSLEEVRPQVQREWAAKRRRELNDAAYEKLRAKYTIRVEEGDAQP